MSESRIDAGEAAEDKAYVKSAASRLALAVVLVLALVAGAAVYLT